MATFRTGSETLIGALRAAAPLVVLAGLGWSPAAAAYCEPPGGSLLWSYPAEGQTGVPTNVELWVLLSSWQPPASASIDDVPLEPLVVGEGRGFDLGELAPETTYTVLLEPDATYGDVEPSTLSFTTGAGPLDADASAAPGAVEASWSASAELSSLCAGALSTQDCFDTGQDTYFVFTPSSSAALGWLIVQENASPPAGDLWPAECGAPRLFLTASTAPCVTLYGLDAAGVAHPGERVCAPELMSTDAGPAPPPTPPAAPPPDAGSAASAPSVPDPIPNRPDPPEPNGPEAASDAGADISRDGPPVATPRARPRRGLCTMRPDARAPADGALAIGLALPALLVLRRRRPPARE